MENGRIASDESESVQQRITRVTTLESLAPCDMVIEAIVEDLAIKTTLFQSLEGMVSEDAVLATNTSSLSVTALARGCTRPERVIGLHFFNPAPLMALVEVIPALQTEADLARHALSQMAAWGKSPALAKDTPGFIVNRVARPFYSEALRILEEGIASVEDIDASMRAQGFRMGPFELMDLIGHDVNYAVTSTVHAAFYGDSRYRPSHTQSQLVAANWLGRKRDRGFYTYEGGVRQEEGRPTRGRRCGTHLGDADERGGRCGVLASGFTRRHRQRHAKWCQLPQGPFGLGRQLGHPGTHQHVGFLASDTEKNATRSLPCFATWRGPRPHVFQLSAFSLRIRTNA